MDFQPTADFEGLGQPILVCRWRLAGGRLTMENRHLRALRGRELAGKPMPSPLVAWAKEHIDWTLERGSSDYPDGVLMLVVDRQFHAAMAVGPYQALESPTLRSLVRRARLARKESMQTRVAPETMWVVRDGRVEWLDDQTNVASGAATFLCDFAKALGFVVVRRDQSLTDVRHEGGYEAAFLVSDEHGVVVPTDHKSMLAQRFADGYRKLLMETMGRKLRHERSTKELSENSTGPS